jgi:hypothetical protein
MLTRVLQFLNGAGNSPKDRVALGIIEMVRHSCTGEETLLEDSFADFGIRLKRKDSLFHTLVTPSMKVQ